MRTKITPLAMTVAALSFSASAVSIYNRRVDFKVGTTELMPSLAASGEISENGKEYTYHPRKGVKFNINQ